MDTNCNDTLELLKECDSGTKMAVSSIDEMMETVSDSGMKDLLIESREHHSKLGNDIHKMLIELGSHDKEPNPMAKSMSWMKTNMKLAMDNSDRTVADLMTDGCDMGIKSLHRYLNKYESASDGAKDICKRLINIEEKLRKDIQKYL